MATCPNCGNATSEGAIFCDQCGTRLPQPEAAAPEAAPPPAGGSMICPSCGAGNVPGEAFCDFCGSPLEAPVPTVQEVPELEPVSREAELEVAAEPAAPPAEEAAPAAEEPAPAAAGEPTCPACGEAVSADEAFCAACGASLALAPIPPEPVPEVEAEPAVEAAPAEAEPAEAEPVELVTESVPVAEAEPVAEPAPPPPPAPVQAPGCPACGAEIEAGDAFCSACGYALQEAPAPAPVVETPPAPAPAGPRLVVADSGAEIPLPEGDEILVGREDPVSGVYPQVDLTPHGGEEGGVSRQHARIIVEGGNYFVEDLDSTNFTFVNKQKLAPKTRQGVGDGDEIRFGRVTAVLRTGS
jgi:predicted amidophosphoribosyltransferase